jgi:flagellar biosynthetic protein FliR
MSVGDLSYLVVPKVQQFLLVLFRVAGILAVAPVFGQKEIPARLKAGLAFFLSVALFPIAVPGMSVKSGLLQENWGLLVIDILREAGVGVLIGYSTLLLFSAIQFGGQLVSRQMGFMMARVLDPLSGQQTSPLVMLQGMVGVLLFFAVNGHHWLLMALNRSFAVVPIGSAVFSWRIPGKLTEMVGGVFSMGIRIAAPAFVLLLLTTVILGIIARAVPQMNILVVGLPIRIGLGLIGMIITVPVFGYLFRRFFSVIQRDVIYLMDTL